MVFTIDNCSRGLCFGQFVLDVHLGSTALASKFVWMDSPACNHGERLGFKSLKPETQLI